MLTLTVTQNGKEMFYDEDPNRKPKKKLVSKNTIPAVKLAELRGVPVEDVKDGKEAYEAEQARLNPSASTSNPMDDLDTPLTVDEDASGESDLERTPEPVVELPQECIFCGEEPKRQKFLNMKRVPLCEEHWQTKTTGEIAQEMRDKQI